MLFIINNVSGLYILGFKMPVPNNYNSLIFSTFVTSLRLSIKMSFSVSQTLKDTHETLRAL